LDFDLLAFRIASFGLLVLIAHYNIAHLVHMEDMQMKWAGSSRYDVLTECVGLGSDLVENGVIFSI
jgi:hypothetical protein